MHGQLTMIITQAWRFRDVSLLLAARCHLVDTSIRHAGHQLFALGTPCSAANLRAQDEAVLGRDELLLGQIRHVQIAIACNNGTKSGRLRHRVRYEGPERLTICAELKGGLCFSRNDGLDIVYCKAATGLGRDDEELLVGREGELRDADGERQFDLGGKG